MATGGPTAAPSDLKAPASPKPVARISGGLKSTARALDALMKAAGPTACSTRTTATSDTESDSHNPAAASAKAALPMMSGGRRPMLSVMGPKTKRNATAASSPMLDSSPA